ncbi:MAG: hypothetical protein MJ228_05145 [Bacilli bacterium]|nr:hypothetical protein [Bacilli bacterium]
MSELKGQMLSMILTLAAFGAIAGALIPAFQESAKTAGKAVTAVDDSGAVSYKQYKAAAFTL